MNIGGKSAFRAPGFKNPGITVFGSNRKTPVCLCMADFDYVKPVAASGLAGLGADLKLQGEAEALSSDRIYEVLLDIRDQLAVIIPQQLSAEPESVPVVEGWLTTAQVAKRLQLTEKTVREAADAGSLPGYKCPPDSKRGQWRFKWDEVEAAMKSNKPRHRSTRKGLEAY